MPKYEVKKDNGRKMTVTAVKTKIALFWLSAAMASSFCSMERRWKSYPSRQEQMISDLFCGRRRIFRAAYLFERLLHVVDQDLNVLFFSFLLL